MVQFLAKSIKPFRIYRKMKYLTFDFYLWPWGQGHKKILLYLALQSYFMVKCLAALVKPFRIYRKMKY